VQPVEALSAEDLRKEREERRVFPEGSGGVRLRLSAWGGCTRLYCTVAANCVSCSVLGYTVVISAHCVICLY
jgi:hypothetical protein